jgi:hypothetical protein
MPKTLYSWKLRQFLPMLTEEEFRPISGALANRANEIKLHRLKHNCSLEESKRVAPTAAMDHYERLTGLRLPSIDELVWARLATYGRPCPSCARLFRTPRAKLCVECGYELPPGEHAGPAT